ncbi:MAG: hypothetical protein IIA87_05030 [Nanoarchaeota archaeon]|nr:hypothetical protein [Nanoarchaeota archaeon]
MTQTQLRHPTLDEIAEEVEKVRNIPTEQQKNIWDNTLREYRRIFKEGFPRFMVLMNDKSFLLNLSYNEDFLRRAGIPKNKVDKHWHVIRAATASLYYDQLIRIKFA